MGKTTLVLKSTKDREDAVYYQATGGSVEQQISSFVSDAAAVYPGTTRIREEWESLFRYLAEEDAVVVVDEVDRYFAVLNSMAEGNRTPNKIAQGAGITSGSVGYYLSRLRDLRSIEQHYPATVDPDRGRKRRYRTSDPLFRFWFRFVYGRTARHEVYGDGAYADLVGPDSSNPLRKLLKSAMTSGCYRRRRRSNPL